MSNYANSSEGRAGGITLKESTVTSINGKTATKLVLHTAKTEDNKPFSQIFYIFDTIGGSMTFAFFVDDAHATERNLKHIEETVQSIRFN